MTTDMKKPPAGRSAEGNTNTQANTRSSSKDTTMDTLYNLGDMVVDGVLTTGRALSRDELTADQIERFESKVDRSAGPDACHLWTGNLDRDGYGRVLIGRTRVASNRIAYVLAFGFVPAGLVVRHKCDTPGCCNPKCLTIGSVADNNRDCVERGRQAAKLTEADVNDMRRRARQGASYADLGREYGVSDAQAHRACTGRTWKSATEPPVTEVRHVQRPWTPAEDAVVFDGTAREVAERLGRTVKSVEHRRALLRRQAVAA